MKYWYGILFFFLLCSCADTKKKELLSLVEQWKNKEIVFPANPVFTVQGSDTVDYLIGDSYKILCYVDSSGCTSCRLQLPRWKELIATLDSLVASDTLGPVPPVQFLFFFVPKRKVDIYYSLRTSNFSYPVCIDQKDSLNRLNHFSSDERFQTFLLNEENRVVAMGNPVHNPKIKELYLGIITGKKVSASSTKLQTTVTLDKETVDMGTFDPEHEQIAEFILTNTGEAPLVIEDVATSCGCITVEYGKEPVQSGKQVALRVKYKADHPEHFSKTITVYCNAQGSPFKLKVKGNAESR